MKKFTLVFLTVGLTAFAGAVTVEPVARNMIRIRRGVGDMWKPSGLERYGFLKTDWPKPAAMDVAWDVDSAGRVFVTSKVSRAALQIDPTVRGKGYSVVLSLKPGERIYGIGDCSRKSVQRRGGRYDMWVANQVCNAPIPVALSSEGWGVFNNSTWRHAWNVGAEREPNAIRIEAEEGTVDLYVFVGKGHAELLDTYTELTGKPRLLPIWGYGFNYVANSEINDFELCAEARTFRKEGIPCDVIGLEPGWMSRDYDMTTKKWWDRRKFHIPYWTDDAYHTFVGALKRMGFHLSLWTCCDYDLTRYEEECLRGEPEAWKKRRTGHPKPPPRDDYRWWEFKFEADLDENYFPEGVQPWFEHYKKFIRQGVEAFKLDGCNQLGAHPNRAWANGMSDQEAHNLYTVLYARQMGRGYEKFTGRRAMVNSGAGYAGVQHYVATWAGDTGGELAALMSAQCLGFSGHANTSCDLEFTPDGLHYGFLQAWTFHDNWDYFRQPWYMGDKLEARFRHYAKLRYSLAPYIYTAAATAHRTGLPIVRALALAYPDVREYDDVKGTYLLGPDLLVSAFEPETVVPDGVWYEWATGRRVVGPCRDRPTKDALWSGGLYARAGAVIPTWKDKQHLDKGWNEEVELLCWPHAADGETVCELYEDDGIGLGYLKGEFATTRLVSTSRNGSFDVKVGDRVGRFAGMGPVRFSVVKKNVKKVGKSLAEDGVSYGSSKR